MKRLLLVGVLALAAAASNRSMAADLEVKAPPPAPVWSWTEFYFGGDVGLAWGKSTWCTQAVVATGCGPAAPTDFVTQTFSGYSTGGQFGYRWQASNNFVVGVEGLFNSLAIGSTTPAPAFPAFTTRTTTFNNLESVTAQVGLAFGRVLVYGKGGWASTELNLDAFNTVTGFDISTYKWVQGWTGGGGVEWLMWTHLSVGLEYGYYEFNVPNINNLLSTGGAIVPCSFCNFRNTSFQMVSARVNFKLWPWGP